MLIISQFAMMPCRFIKGFEISRSKLADMVGSEKVDAAHNGPPGSAQDL